MKTLLTLCCAALLWSGVAAARADMIPGPEVPERKTPQEIVFRSRQFGTLCTVAAGITAVCLAGSLVVLRCIRKKTKAQQSPEPPETSEA